MKTTSKVPPVMATIVVAKTVESGGAPAWEKNRANSPKCNSAAASPAAPVSRRMMVVGMDPPIFMPYRNSHGAEATEGRQPLYGLHSARGRAERGPGSG